MTFLATALETVLNQALRLDPPSLQTLGTLAGKIIRIEVSSLNWQFNLFPDNQGIIILSEYHGEVNTQVRGAPFTLLRLLLQADSTLIDNPDVTVQGEVHIAQQLLTVLHGLQLDWEKHLARLLSEVPAHQFVRLLRKSREYTTAGFNTLQRQITSYLQEKTRHLPARAEVDSFFQEVGQLQEELDRLEQQVVNLMNNE
jgi:ubiquinone biosynthesis protein UbiJ